MELGESYPIIVKDCAQSSPLVLSCAPHLAVTSCVSDVSLHNPSIPILLELLPPVKNTPPLQITIILELVELGVILTVGPSAVPVPALLLAEPFQSSVVLSSVPLVAETT